MLAITNKLFLFKYKRIWFPNSIPKLNLFEFISLRQCNKELVDKIDAKTWFKIDFSTLHTNLLLDEQKLFSNIAKNTKYEIKRAMKENIETKKATLKEFIPFFNTFAPTKNLKQLSYRNLNAYGTHLFITKASHDNTSIIMHAYILDIEENSRVRLLYSATINRTNTDIDLNMVGRANRFLHWQDILLFKKMGFCIYDWGGICGNPEAKQTAGIDAFKMAFGGTIITEPNYESKLLHLIKKLLSHL